MVASVNSVKPRLLVGVNHWLLLGLSAAIALALLAGLISMVIMAYLAVTSDRIPRAFELFGMVGTTTILGLILAFLMMLRKIVISAGQAPFGVENARRLRRLGWIALAWQVVVLIFAFAGHQINIVNLPGILVSIVDARSYSANGAILVLALFILAQIFNEGAAMRDELEGTV